MRKVYQCARCNNIPYLLLGSSLGDGIAITIVINLNVLLKVSILLVHVFVSGLFGGSNYWCNLGRWSALGYFVYVFMRLYARCEVVGHQQVGCLSLQQ